MDQQKKLSKMQKLILRTIYKDFKEKPMRGIGQWKKTYDKDGKLEDMIEKKDNRWQMGIPGCMRYVNLSRIISKKMVNKRLVYDADKKIRDHEDSYAKTNNEKYLTYIKFIKGSPYKKHKEEQTDSFRASISRSLQRLSKRGLVILYNGQEYGAALFHDGTNHSMRYAKYCMKAYGRSSDKRTYGISLTSEGERIAKKIKLSECLPKQTVNKH